MKKFRGIFAASWILFLVSQVNWADESLPQPEYLRRELQAQAAGLVEASLRIRADGESGDVRQLLSRAVTVAPDFAPARWQLGEFKQGPNWTSAKSLLEASSSDANFAEYSRQREECSRSAKPIWLNQSASISIDGPQDPQDSRAIRYYLRKTFELPQRPKTAQLRIQAVGNCSVFINGHEVMETTTNRKLGTDNVEGRIKDGKNVIAISIQGVNERQVPGVRLFLECVEKDHTIATIATDESWKVSTTKSQGWSDTQFDDGPWKGAVPSESSPAANDELSADIVISPRLESALAKWCQAHELPEQARFHWTRLLHFNPSHPEAMKALALIPYNGQLLTKSQLENQKKADRDAKAAFIHWYPILAKACTDLERGQPRGIESARKKLDEADLNTILAFEQVEKESNSSPVFVAEYVEHVLARFPEPTATRVLTRIVCAYSQPNVIERASVALKARDPLSFVPQLMGSLAHTIEVKTSVHSEGRDVVCSATYLSKGVYVDDEKKETFRFSPDNSSKSRDQAMTKAHAKQKEIEDDVVQKNLSIHERNSHIMNVLRRVTDADPGNTAENWWKWWGDYNELLMPTQHQIRQTAYFNTEYIRNVEETRRREKDCFAKGTPVWTQFGLRPIETIKVGDAILAQDVDTGELALKVVLGTSIRPASPMTGVQVGEEMIASTRGHRYWIEGTGWRMAKNLTSGGRLHSTTESPSIDEVVDLPDQVAFNLIVEDFHSYFVGRRGILVHDSGAPRPTLSKVPGLAR